MGLVDGLFGGIGDVLGIDVGALPVVGSLFPDKNEKELRELMLSLASSMQQNRGDIERAGVRSLQNELSAYAPMNSLLGEMYGPDGMLDLDTPAQSPLPQGFTGKNPLGAGKAETVGKALASVTGKQREVLDSMFDKEDWKLG